ncbi:MAG: LysE family translocator [Pseudomonadota bacterium]
MSEAFLFPLPLILLGWALGGGSPGPATLAISGTAMGYGRLSGLTLAFGVVIGSACWGIAAALGFSAIMTTNLWLAETVRYLGAAYLLYLALKSLRAAWVGKVVKQTAPPARRAFFIKGLLLHLTNPKAILGWGSIYAIALVPEAPAASVWVLFACLSATSCVVFLGYAVIFSAPPIARGYLKAKRLFDAGFGLLFGAASLKLLTTRLT